MRAFSVRLRRLLLEAVGATVGPALALLVVIGGAWLYGVPFAAATAAAMVVAIPLLFRLATALARGLFRPGEGRDRLVPCDERTARHLHRYVRLLGRLFAAFAPVALALEANHYPRSAIEAVWLVYEVLTLVAVVLLFARRGTFDALIPKATTRLGAAARSAAAIVYPLAALYVIGTIAVHSLGYVNLARFLGWATALSGLVLLGASIVWKYLGYRLDRALERRIATISEGKAREEVEPEVRQLRGFHGTVRTLARLAILTAAALALLASWGLDARQIRALVAGRYLVSWESAGSVVGITLFDLYECVLIVVVAFLGGRIARSLLRSTLGRRSTLDRGTQEAIANTGFIAAIAVGVYLVLATLRVNLEAAKWLGGAVGLGIGFGLQNIVNNFVSGIILLIEKPIRTDDVVEVGGVIGRVDQIGTRSTVIVDNDNIARIVPNSEFVSSQVTNWSYGDPRTRIRLPVGVAYGTDPHLVRQVLIEVASSHGLILKKPAPDVMFRSFGDSALNFELVCFVLDPIRIPRISSDLNYATVGAFKKHGIEIPFPQRDFHVREPIIHRIVREPRRAEGHEEKKEKT